MSVISRTRGGTRRESNIQSDVSDWWDFVDLIFGEKVYPHFRRAVDPVRIKHDVIVFEWCLIMYEWEGLCGVWVVRGVDSVR